MLIYQIGNQILRGYANISNNVTYEDTSYISNTNNMLYFKSTLPKIEPVRVTVNGNLYIFNNTTPHKQINNLLSMAGKPYVDVIGYMPKEYKFAYGEINFNNSDTDNARWFHTYGQIVSVNKEINDENDFNVEMPLSLELVINPVWCPLNEWVWFARYELSNIYSVTELTALTLEKETLPKSVVDFHYSPQFRFYRRGGYDTTALELYTNSNSMWSNWLDDTTIYEYHTNSPTGVDMSFEANTLDNYAPYIIYKFSGDAGWDVSGYPVVTITVSSDTRGMRLNTFTTTFNLEIEDGQHFIIPSDIEPFIVDNSDNIIKNTFNGENKSLEITYESSMPAVLYGTTNTVSITFSKPVVCEVLVYSRTI